VPPAPVLRARVRLARPTRRPARRRRFVSFVLLRVPIPRPAAPGPRRPRPPTGPATPPSPRPRRPLPPPLRPSRRPLPPPLRPSLRPPLSPPAVPPATPLPSGHPAGHPPPRGSPARPLGSPPLSREVPAAVPQSPQPHRREAPALARAVTPARLTPTVCRAALSASAAVSRDGPGSPLHIPSDHPWEYRCRAILHLPRNCWGGHDLLCKWSVHGVFPIQCGPTFYLREGLVKFFFEKSREVMWAHVARGRRPPRGLAALPRPSPVPPTDMGLRNRGVTGTD
jgi:hypothetical protein